jgi:hypothetical protein
MVGVGSPIGQVGAPSLTSTTARCAPFVAAVGKTTLASANALSQGVPEIVVHGGWKCATHLCRNCVPGWMVMLPGSLIE